MTIKEVNIFVEKEQKRFIDEGNLELVNKNILEPGDVILLPLSNLRIKSYKIMVVENVDALYIPESLPQILQLGKYEVYMAPEREKDIWGDVYKISNIMHFKTFATNSEVAHAIWDELTNILPSLDVKYVSNGMFFLLDETYARVEFRFLEEGFSELNSCYNQIQLYSKDELE